MFDHVTLQVADVRASAEFYETILAPLGIALVVDEGPVAGFFGPEPGGFWLCPAKRDQDRELHLAFRAANREQVRALHQAAVNVGAEILHEPRIFPEYDPFYFGAFVRDLDGHNIEAVCTQPE